MRRRATLLAATLVATTLMACGIASAEPQMNQVLVKNAECSDGNKYSFVLNGEGNSGHVLQSTSNVITTHYTVEYYSDGTLVATDSFSQGKKTGQQLIHCEGEATLVHWQLGPVTAVFDFDGFVTPRGKG
jgi:hypothetical protein